jgi:predicted metal-dependent peptidase
MNTDKDMMQIAKGHLALKAGFWLALASKMEWKPIDDCPGGVAATDGAYVYYNKENINARPLSEAVYIALHEIGHPMLCHLTRRGNREPKKYGAAIDIVLNKLLNQIMTETPDLKMSTPKDALLGSAFDIPDSEITTVEHVYDLLNQWAKKNGGKPIPQFDEHGTPKGEDGKPLTPTQMEAMEKSWKVSVQAAAVMAKQMGKLPGFLEEFIGELLQPKVDWRAQLRNCTARIAKDESSYRRFNRRHLHRRSYLPGMYSERIEAVAYFVDTSGSISSEECKQAGGEMSSLLEDMKPTKIYFGQCDTKLHCVDELTPDDLPLPGLKIYGRGGTDMREAFAWACAHEHEIEVFILQTDGYIPPLDPSLVPNVPVIWIITTNAVLPSGCDFGTHIRVVV